MLLLRRGNKRSRLLALTECAESRREELTALADCVEREMTDGLSEMEAETLSGLLRKGIKKHS